MLRISGAPSQEDVDDANRPTLMSLLEEMTRAGLFKPSTVPEILQARLWGVRTLIAEGAPEKDTSLIGDGLRMPAWSDGDQHHLSIGFLRW